jgi:endo-1,4-beta-xylanase
MTMRTIRFQRLIPAAIILAVIALFSQTPVPNPVTTPASAPSRGAVAWVDPGRDEPTGMHYKTFHSPAAGGEVSYLIYLPPDYATATRKRYPTVYWLHGLNGRQTGGAPLTARADRAIRAGDLPPLIVVSVNGLRAGMYTDSKDGRQPVETVIVRDLITHIDATYRTIARREARAIEGMSMGGYGALRLGFKFPDIFGVVSSYAAALHTEETIAAGRRPAPASEPSDASFRPILAEIFATVYGRDKQYARTTTPWTILQENSEQLRRRQQIRLIIGTADRLLDWNRQYHKLLDELGIEHQYTEIEGVAHNYGELEEKTGQQTLGFYRKAFEGLHN